MSIAGPCSFGFRAVPPPALTDVTDPPVSGRSTGWETIVGTEGARFKAALRFDATATVLARLIEVHQSECGWKPQSI